MHNKKELRKFFAEKRAQCNKKSETDIINNLINSDEYNNASVLYAYASFKTEIDTSSVIEDCFKKKKAICLPKCNKETHTMKFIEVFSQNDLKPGAYGIYEPISETESTKKADIILVPALSCDNNGNRLGYGGGYYDRYLGKNKGIFSIVLLYDSLLTDYLPYELTDIPVNMIITESRIIRI